jgi:hypothetical protein
MTLTDNLIALKAQYESALETPGTKAVHYRELLTHVDALLLNQLPSTSNGSTLTATPELATAQPQPSAIATQPSTPTKAPDSRVSLPLLPAYEGLKKLDAIALVMQSRQGTVVHQDEIIQTIYGDLNPEALKVERLRMKAALIQGVNKKLWQKAPKPSSYILKSSKATEKANPSSTGSQPKSAISKAKTPRSGESFQVLPQYQGMTKTDAISQVLTEQSDQVVHQDTIIRLMYGDLSAEELNLESRRMRSSLFQGVSRGLWERAPKEPSSYTLKSAKAKSAKTSKPKTPPKPPTPVPASVKIAPAGAKTPASKKATPATKKTPTRFSKASPAKPPQPKKTQPEIVSLNGKMLGAKPILTVHKDFAGLSKIDAVLKVMNETPGKPVHVNDIIERLYGKLSEAEAKAEKGRMKDVMNRGQGRKLWTKARAPLSFVVGGARGRKVG